MTIDIGGAVRDAWQSWRRETDLIVRVASVFFFLPLFAFGLFRPAPPAILDQPITLGDPEIARALLDHAVTTAPWTLTVSAFAIAGAATLYAMLLKSQIAVGDALRVAFSSLITLLIAMFLAQFAIFGGLLLLVLPGLYLIGRLFPLGVAIVAERRRNPIEAFARSWALTRGHGWMLLFVMAAIYFASRVLLSIVEMIRAGLGDGSSIATAIAIAIVAAIGAAAAVAEALVKVSVYRRLAARRA